MQKPAEVDWWCFSPTLTPSSSFSDCQRLHAVPGLSTPAVIWQPPLRHHTLVVLVAYPRGALVRVMLTVDCESMLPLCVIIVLSSQKTKHNIGICMEMMFFYAPWINLFTPLIHSNLWCVFFIGMVTYGFIICVLLFTSCRTKCLTLS